MRLEIHEIEDNLVKLTVNLTVEYSYNLVTDQLLIENENEDKHQLISEKIYEVILDLVCKYRLSDYLTDTFIIA